MIMFTDNTRAYDVIETAKMLNVIPQTVRNYLKTGRLSGQTVKRKIYVYEESINDLIQESRRRSNESQR